MSVSRNRSFRMDAFTHGQTCPGRPRSGWGRLKNSLAQVATRRSAATSSGSHPSSSPPGDSARRPEALCRAGRACRGRSPSFAPSPAVQLRSTAREHSVQPRRGSALSYLARGLLGVRQAGDRMPGRDDRSGQPTWAPTLPRCSVQPATRSSWDSTACTYRAARWRRVDDAKTPGIGKTKENGPAKEPSFLGLVEAAGIEPASENATQSGLHA